MDFLLVNCPTNWSRVGIISKSEIRNFQNNYLENRGNACSVLVYYSNSYDSRIYCGSSYVVSDLPYYPSGTIISLEVDMSKKGVFFFVDKKQLPYYVRNVPEVVVFALSGYNTISYEIKSFQKLSNPSINPSLKCTEFDWK